MRAGARAYNAERLKNSVVRMSNYGQNSSHATGLPLPLPYIEELSRLLDNVQPFPTSMAMSILQQDLKRPLNDCFQSFSDMLRLPRHPSVKFIAAQLKTGELVAVKIRRPGIDRIVRVDLRVMKVLAWVSDFSTVFMTVSMRDFYSEFSDYTRQELDYTIEARHIERIRRNMEDSEIVRVPRVFQELTTTKVLCLEFLEGI